MNTHLQRQMVERKYIPAGTDPRHVEAYILVGSLRLSEASWSEIRREIRIALGCIKEGGPAAAERLALSYGL